MNIKPLGPRLVLIAIALSGSPSFARDADSREGRAPAPDAPRRAASTDPAARVLDQVELNATPFREAVERLREQTGANLFVSWNVLKRAGVGADTPVDVDLADVTLGRALDLILADVAGGEGRLGWAHENHLEITRLLGAMREHLPAEADGQPDPATE
jgi:hypothetical protein